MFATALPRPKNPGYAKLHTGIYIAALYDAMQRVDDVPDNKIVGQSSNIRHGKEREAGSGPGFGARHKRNDEAADSDNLKVDQMNRKGPDQCEDEEVKVH